MRTWSFGDPAKYHLHVVPTRMNIIFMGTSGFGIPCAHAILESGRSITSVVTVPDKPQGRGLQTLPSPIKQWAQSHNLPILQPVKLRDPEFIEAIRSLAPDVIVVVAFRILPPEIFSIPSRGSFNLHASLLPKYRGAAPIQWSLINGERETGVTTFFLKEQVDTGNIIVQEKIPIGERETFGELHDRLATLGASVVLRTLDMIENNTAKALVQDDTQSSPAPKITKELCRIDWHKPAREIHNLVRALSPAPGAWTTIDGSVVKIFLAIPVANGSITAVPGTCTINGDRLLVATGAGMIEIVEAQREGRKRMTTANFIQGRNIKHGDLFQ